MSDIKYPMIMRIMHWLMAALIIGLLVIGLSLESIPEDASYRFTIYKLHKSFGVLAFILVVARLIIRWTKTIPELPEALSKTEKFAAHWAHRILYIGMIVMPVSGFVMSSATPKRYGVEFFGLRLPDLPASQTFSSLGHTVHGAFAWFFIALIVFHVVGVIKHRFFDKADTDVLKRML